MPEPFVVCGEGRTVIRRPPKDILEFVLDVDQYRRADLKIGRVHYVHRDGNQGEVRHGGRLLGLPVPAAVLAFTLNPYSRLDFRGVAMPWPVRGFNGFFTCQESDEGTIVVHRECFIFGRVSGQLFKLILGWWLRRDTPAEVLRMKRFLERETP